MIEVEKVWADILSNKLGANVDRILETNIFPIFGSNSVPTLTKCVCQYLPQIQSCYQISCTGKGQIYIDLMIITSQHHPNIGMILETNISKLLKCYWKPILDQHWLSIGY